ncbi:MAG: hypothetical protein KDA41_19795, partial [Planctomycetales bacterium]|nr:hypothetical protein [Planctomycetales bacterium]
PVVARMFTVTESACERLCALLDSAGVIGAVSLRLVGDASGNGIDLRLEPVQAGDVTFAFRKRIVLAVDETVVDKLADKTLDLPPV